MKKFIFLFCVLFVSTQQVFASNNILEEKYKELADLVYIDAQYATMVEGKTDIYIVNAATTAQKNNAGSWARSIANLNLPYNDAFWSNKYCKTTDYYNCSQLVWCAYKQTSNIDLDSNLGFGVYPSDIISSSSLTYARTD